MKAIVIRLIVAVVAIVVLLSTAHGQAPQPVAMDSYVESVRADIRADKIAVIAQAMNFNADEAKEFWPVYRKYEAQIVGLNDDRVALMRSYMELGASIDAGQAANLTMRMLEFDCKRAALHKKYVAELQKTRLPATTILQVVQLEHRFDLFVEMKIASSVPPNHLQAAAVR